MTTSDPSLTPLESPQIVDTLRRRLSIGLPAAADGSERRFPLTPEAAGRLVENGYRVVIQRGAGKPINYTDEQYAASGTEITSRQEVLTSDIVISMAALTADDVSRLRQGAMLITLLNRAIGSPNTIAKLLSRKIITIALDLVTDRDGNTPFADILAEIDGRASIALASSLLADPSRGKGILLGGVAGVIPCEVTIIGSGIAGIAAARSASGLGAMVRMFDDNVYSLRRASDKLGASVITSVLHPKVLSGAFRSADVVVIATDGFKAGEALTASMKRGVVVFDLSSAPGKAFPSMRAVDLAAVAATDPSASLLGRLCLINAGSAVPRSAAMALGNSLLTLLSNLGSCDTPTAFIRNNPAISRATLTFYGQPVNPVMARAAGLGNVDISIFLTLS